MLIGDARYARSDSSTLNEWIHKSARNATTLKTRMFVLNKFDEHRRLPMNQAEKVAEIIKGNVQMSYDEVSKLYGKRFPNEAVPHRSILTRARRIAEGEPEGGATTDNGSDKPRRGRRPKSEQNGMQAAARLQQISSVIDMVGFTNIENMLGLIETHGIEKVKAVAEAMKTINAE